MKIKDNVGVPLQLIIRRDLKQFKHGGYNRDLLGAPCKILQSMSQSSVVILFIKPEHHRFNNYRMALDELIYE